MARLYPLGWWTATAHGVLCDTNYVEEFNCFEWSVISLATGKCVWTGMARDSAAARQSMEHKVRLHLAKKVQEEAA